VPVAHHRHVHLGFETNRRSPLLCSLNKNIEKDIQQDIDIFANLEVKIILNGLAKQARDGANV